MSLTTGISPDKPLRSMDGLALANALKRRWPALVYQVQTDGRSLDGVSIPPPEPPLPRMIGGADIHSAWSYAPIYLPAVFGILFLIAVRCCS